MCKGYLEEKIVNQLKKLAAEVTIVNYEEKVA